MSAGNFLHLLHITAAIAVVTYIGRIVGSCLVDSHTIAVCTKSAGVGTVLIFMRTRSTLHGFYIAAALIMNMAAYTVVLF